MNLLSHYTFQGVNCMRQNTVEMTVTIIQSTTTHDLTTIGWTKGYVMNYINKEKISMTGPKSLRDTLWTSFYRLWIRSDQSDIFRSH